MARKQLKYMALAEELQRRIRRGDYSGTMPGVRKLADEFDVDPKTAWRAVDALVNLGVLYRPNARSTYVTSRPGDLGAASHRRPSVIRVVNSYERYNRPASPFINAFMGGVKQAGKRHHIDIRVEPSETPLGRSSHPKFTRRFIEQLPPDSWVVFFGSDMDAQAADAVRHFGVHAIFADSSGDLGRLHRVEFDWRGGMIDLVTRLRTLGHRRILWLMPRPGSEGSVTSEIERGRVQGMDRMRVGHDAGLVRYLDSMGPPHSPEQVAEWLDVHPRPTLVVSKMVDYATIREAASRLQLRVPSQLNVVMLGDTAQTRSPAHATQLSGAGQSMGRFAVETLVTYAGQPMAAHIRVEMNFRPGRTLARAPRSND